MRASTEAETREMWEMYKQGMKRDAIAEAYYISVSGMEWRFRQLDLKAKDYPEIEPYVKIRRNDMKEICKMRRRGMTYEQIALEYGVVASTIQYAFKRYGIPKIRRRRENDKDSNRARGIVDNGGGNAYNTNCNGGAMII